MRYVVYFSMFWDAVVVKVTHDPHEVGGAQRRSRRLFLTVLHCVFVFSLGGPTPSEAAGGRPLTQRSKTLGPSIQAAGYARPVFSHRTVTILYIDQSLDLSPRTLRTATRGERRVARPVLHVRIPVPAVRSPRVIFELTPGTSASRDPNVPSPIHPEIVGRCGQSVTRRRRVSAHTITCLACVPSRWITQRDFWDSLSTL